MRVNMENNLYYKPSWYVDNRLIKHSSAAYQKHSENEYQRIDDLRNANRDVARLMFCQALLQK